MIAGILAKIGLGAIADISKQMRGAYQDKLNAANEKDRIDADQAIATLEARKAVLVAEERAQWNIAFRAFLALPFGLFIWKVIVADKILGWGTTDDLSPDLWNLMMVVYGFYFVYETAALFKKQAK